jgi:hypothetical protein
MTERCVLIGKRESIRRSLINVATQPRGVRELNRDFETVTRSGRAVAMEFSNTQQLRIIKE